MRPFAELFDEMQALHPRVGAAEVSRALFEATGVIIARNALGAADCARFEAAWAAYYARHRDERSIHQYNAVDFLAPASEALDGIIDTPSVLDLVETVIGPDIGLYGGKLLVKDARSDGPVFLHQDFCYQHGLAPKATVFVALTPANAESGMLRVYMGTHRLGYLGDAGQLRGDLLPDDWPVVTAEVRPGDAIIMNSMSWHDSPPNRSGAPRVLYSVTYQPASDYTTQRVLRGGMTVPKSFMNAAPEGGLFARSRSTRLRELQAFADAHASD